MYYLSPMPYIELLFFEPPAQFRESAMRMVAAYQHLLLSDKDESIKFQFKGKKIILIKYKAEGEVTKVEILSEEDMDMIQTVAKRLRYYHNHKEELTPMPNTKEFPVKTVFTVVAIALLIVVIIAALITIF